jgi:L-rhamnose mutarotase
MGNIDTSFLKGYKMAGVKKISVRALLGVMIVVLIGCTQTKVKHIGMVIGIKPEKIAEYKKLHADSYSGVRDLLNKYNMHNFSIYLHEIDGKYYEFGYYEYTGNNYEGDMARLAAEPRNKKWLSICDPMQIPLKGYKSWAQMEEVYHND